MSAAEILDQIKTKAHCTALIQQEKRSGVGRKWKSTLIVKQGIGKKIRSNSGERVRNIPMKERKRSSPSTNARGW